MRDTLLPDDDRFLLDEQLAPGEIARVEQALFAELARRPTSSTWRRRRILLAVAATLLLAFVVSSYMIVPENDPQPESVRGSEGRGMSIMIVRTDVPDADPYTLVVEFEPEPVRRSEEVDKP